MPTAGVPLHDGDEADREGLIRPGSSGRESGRIPRAHLDLRPDCIARGVEDIHRTATHRDRATGVGERRLPPGHQLAARVRKYPADE